MRQVYRLWNLGHQKLAANSAMLVATNLVNSVLGFVFWGYAANHVSTSEVGLAAAAISAMMLLASVGSLGLGTLLIGELKIQPHSSAALIATSLVSVGLTGLGLGLAFALTAPMLIDDLQPLFQGPDSALLFAIGVSAAAVALVLDQALVGLLRGSLQLLRNSLFSAVKLGALVVALSISSFPGALAIYGAWLAGNLLSFLAPAGVAVRESHGPRALRLQFDPLRKLGVRALAHHALNLAMQGNALLMPLVVTGFLGASAAAYYYTAIMIAVISYMVPTALSTVLFAVSGDDRKELSSRIRFTLLLSFALGIAANVVVYLGAPAILGFFGPDYAENAAWPLRLLTLGVFPFIIREHYVAVRRIQGRMAQAARLIVFSDLPKLGVGAVGAVFGGLVGLVIGNILVALVEALVMAPTVYRAARGTPRQWR